jgi:hypothetical protein
MRYNDKLRARERVVFPVEIRISERDLKSLAAKMSAIREWLDHRRFEPSIFRYTFEPPGHVFLVEFKVGTEAAEFATSFGGRLIASSAEREAA